MCGAGGPKPPSKPAFQRYEPHRETNGVSKKYDVSTDAVDTAAVGSKQKRHVNGDKGETETQKKKKKVKTETEA